VSCDQVRSAGAGLSPVPLM